MVKSLRNKTNRNKRKVRRQHKKRTVKRYKRRGGGFISDSWSSIKIPQCVKDNPKAYVLNPNGPGYLKDYNVLKTERDKERAEFFNPLYTLLKIVLHCLHRNNKVSLWSHL